MARRPRTSTTTPASAAASNPAPALLDRIVIDPNVAFGKPAVIRGTRIRLGLILGLLADGMTHDEFLADYPG